MDFFATAAKGTEPALRDELRELRLSEVRADRGGVHFAGPFEDAWRACLWSRVAVRVLAWRAAFPAPDGEGLYEGVRAIDWSPFLSRSHTLAVKATCRSSRLTHTQFIAQKTKDAIVDSLREQYGARPSVDLRDPDVNVVVHLVKNQADVYLDMSGGALHKRGYRARAGDAPLKETLAAAVVRLSGWDRKRPLVDPMCGSGTIAIEAAAWARGLAPGLARARFGFERWAYFDASMQKQMAELREDARAEPLRRKAAREAVVSASDIDGALVALARTNAEDAGVTLTLEKRDVRDIAPTVPPGVIVTNPPYGARLDSTAALYGDMGRVFSRLHGHSLAILAGSSAAQAIEKAIAVEKKSWLLLYNGDIECKLLSYDVP